MKKSRIKKKYVERETTIFLITSWRMSLKSKHLSYTWCPTSYQDCHSRNDKFYKRFGETRDSKVIHRKWWHKQAFFISTMLVWCLTAERSWTIGFWILVLISASKCFGIWQKFSVSTSCSRTVCVFCRRKCWNS